MRAVEPVLRTAGAARFAIVLILLFIPLLALPGVGLAAGSPAAAGWTAGGDGPAPQAPAWEPTAIQVSYPQLDALANPALGDEVVPAINEAIREQALQLVAAASAFGSVSGEYRLSLQQDHLISLTLTYSGFGPYMAHPMHYRRSLTADLRTGAIYTLADLLRPGALEQLARLVEDELRRQDVPLLVDQVVLSPEHDFYLTPEALVVYFQLYEVAPYAWGFPEAVIPYGNLGELVSPRGPLGHLAGSTQP